MVFRCRSHDCDHEHTSTCQSLINSWKCCECNGPMYKSEVHTPASNCSAGSGLCSLGPAGSTMAMDEFDRQLMEKLDTLGDDSVAYNSKAAAELAAQKVANWKQEIDDLLVDDTHRIIADPHDMDLNDRDEEDMKSIIDAQKGDGDFDKPHGSNLRNRKNENDTSKVQNH